MLSVDVFLKGPFIYLLDVDAVQGLNLLGGGGGFRFVVSVSLKDKPHTISAEH